MNIEKAVNISEHLDRIIIKHAAFSTALEGIKLCVLKSQTYRDSINCTLTAIGGLGKTTICDLLVDSFQSQDIELEDRIVLTKPAMKITIPPKATIKSVATRMLIALDDIKPEVGTLIQLEDRVCKLLNSRLTKLVFLDEFHRLFRDEKNAPIFNQNVCAWVQSLVDETKTSWCLVGATAFTSQLTPDSQMSRRFPLHYKMKLLNMEAAGGFSPFIKKLLTTIEELTNIDATNLSNELAFRRIYAGTRGNPDFIIKLFKEAILSACLNDSRILSEEHMRLAWDTGITFKSSYTSTNPFNMGFSTLDPNDMVSDEQ